MQPIEFTLPIFCEQDDAPGTFDEVDRTSVNLTHDQIQSLLDGLCAVLDGGGDIEDLRKTAQQCGVAEESADAN